MLQTILKTLLKLLYIVDFELKKNVVDYKENGNREDVENGVDYTGEFCRIWEKNKDEYLKHAIERNCPVCHSSGGETYFNSQDGYRFIRCENCGMIYAPSVIRMSFWNDNYSLLEEVRDVENRRLKARVLNELNTEDRARFTGYLNRLSMHTGTLAGKKYLDVGTFYGDALRVAQEFGIEAYGIEAKKNVARIAKEETGLRVEAGTGETLEPGIFGGNFDIVSLYEVLEHSSEPGESLRRVHAEMADGGYVIASVPNADNIELKMLREYCHHCLGGVVITGHVNLFDHRTLERIFRQSGFEVVDTFTQYMSSMDSLYLFVNERYEFLNCYSNAVSGEYRTPAISKHVRKGLALLSRPCRILENLNKQGPILCIIARKQ